MSPLRAAAVLLVLAFAAAAARPEGDPLPEDFQAWRRRQDAQVARGEGERALDEARARAKREPKNPEALYLLGRILGNTGRIEEARVQFEGALEVDINYAPAWCGMAIVHLQQKDYDTALREARKAHDLEPTTDTLVIVVTTLYEKGDRPAAYRLLQEELARRPADDDLRFLYATRLFEEQNWREAEKELRVILANDAAHFPARQSLAYLLMNTGRPDEAVSLCREEAKRDPRNPRIRVLLRSLLVQKEDYAGAAAVVEEILKLDLKDDLRAEAEKDLEALRRAAAAPREARPVDPDEVLRLLDSPDAVQRREAMRTLWEQSLNFLPDAAVRRVTDSDETVRLYAVRLLGRYGDARTGGLLEVILFHPRDRDASSAVRTQAAVSLGRIGSPAVLPVLVRALEDPDPDVLRSAIQGVSRITGKSFVDDVLAPVPERERPAVRERYRKWWMEEPTGRLWRRKAAEAVGRSGMRSLAWYLFPWLLEEDAAVRGAAVEAFASILGDASLREARTETAEERRALSDRITAAFGEKR